MNPQPLTFGNYTGAQNDAIGSLQVYCNSGSFTAAGVGLSIGSAPTYYPRTMTKGASTLQYNIYTTAARQFVGGDGSGGTSFPPITNGAVNQSFSLYGRIPSGQSVALGSYTDTLVITIFF